MFFCQTGSLCNKRAMRFPDARKRFHNLKPFPKIIQESRNGFYACNGFHFFFSNFFLFLFPLTSPQWNEGHLLHPHPRKEAQAQAISLQAPPPRPSLLSQAPPISPQAPPPRPSLLSQAPPISLQAPPTRPSLLAQAPPISLQAPPPRPSLLAQAPPISPQAPTSPQALPISLQAPHPRALTPLLTPRRSGVKDRILATPPSSILASLLQIINNEKKEGSNFLS